MLEILSAAVTYTLQTLAAEPRCYQHGCHPHECFRRHYPQAYRS